MLLAWVGGTVLLVPAIIRPTLGIALIAAAVGLWLASKSVAYPLALAFAPSLVEATYGSNPLPKGGTTFLFLGWIGLAILIAMVREGQPRGLVSAPVIITIVLVVLMVAQLGSSLDPSYGSKKLQLFIANNVAFMLAGVFVGARRRDTQLLLTLLLVISAIGAILLIGKLAAGTASQVITDRFSLSAQEYPISLGRSASDGLLLAIYAMLAWRSLPGRLWAMAMVPALAVSLIAAGSRGPVLAFAFALAAFVVMLATSGRARTQLTRLTVVGLSAIVVVPLLVPGSAVSRAVSVLFGGANGLSTSGRNDLWAIAINTFSAHPLTGIGTGGFAGLQTGELYPHNVLLEGAVELGLLGAILVAWFIVGSLRRMIRLWRSRPQEDKLEVAVIIALFIAALVNALFSGAFQDNRELWLWSGLAIGISVRHGRVPGPVRARRRRRHAPTGTRYFTPRAAP